MLRDNLAKGIGPLVPRRNYEFANLLCCWVSRYSRLVRLFIPWNDCNIAPICLHILAERVPSAPLGAPAPVREDSDAGRLLRDFDNFSQISVVNGVSNKRQVYAVGQDRYEIPTAYCADTACLAAFDSPGDQPSEKPPNCYISFQWREFYTFHCECKMIFAQVVLGSAWLSSRAERSRSY